MNRDFIIDIYWDPEIENMSSVAKRCGAEMPLDKWRQHQQNAPFANHSHPDPMDKVVEEVYLRGYPLEVR